jgi:hypothetical protein
MTAMTNPFSNGKDRIRFSDSLDSERVRLAELGRRHVHDEQLEWALTLFREDRDRFNRLPQQLKSHVGIYADFKEQHARAVEAGALPANDDPSAA